MKYYSPKAGELFNNYGNFLLLLTKTRYSNKEVDYLVLFPGHHSKYKHEWCSITGSVFEDLKYKI